MFFYTFEPSWHEITDDPKISTQAYFLRAMPVFDRSLLHAAPYFQDFDSLSFLMTKKKKKEERRSIQITRASRVSD